MLHQSAIHAAILLALNPMTAPDLESIQSTGITTEPHLILGLQEVVKLRKPHWYSVRHRRIYRYKLEGTERTLDISIKLRKIKDLRPYQDRYPGRAWVQDFARRWGPVWSLGWGIYPLYAPFAPGRQ